MKFEYIPSDPGLLKNSVRNKRISLIAAMADNRVIGIHNRLPWHMPADLDHFRKITHRKPFIMGRNSYKSKDVILSDYKSVILSHNKDIKLKDTCYIASNLLEAFEILKDEMEIFILGGEQVYRQTIFLAGYIYLTVIHTSVDGDAVFPEFDLSEWIIKNEEYNRSDKRNPFDCTFYEYWRKS